MATGVRYLKSKTVVKLAALDMFLEMFVADPMLDGLIEMCELAATHPDFDANAARAYDWADQATDILTTFFLSWNCCEEGPDGAPRVQLDSQHGAIALLKPRIRPRRREPSLAHADRPVPMRLAKRYGASNQARWRPDVALPGAAPWEMDNAIRPWVGRVQPVRVPAGIRGGKVT